MDDDSEDQFTQSAMMMRRFAEAWSSEIAAIGTKSKEQMAGESDVQISSELMDLDILDSDWLTNMFLVWDH